MTPRDIVPAQINHEETEAGPFSRWGKCVSLSQIRDGTSNTIFFGELRALWSMHSQAGWAASDGANGYYSTIIPINYETSNRDGGPAASGVTDADGHYELSTANRRGAD